MPDSQSLPSIWQLKPWWCQPWSIVLTGITLISGSWLLFQTIWVTLLVALPILVWMGFFLLVYPKAMQQVLAEQAREEG
ncbi:hypothetical protein IFO70_13245 [Phormidium tenue FACHB-886]|nr:hypothetical protein [Phormidium tenue FACHB-886]